MTNRETELKALMLAGLDGDAASHRALLDKLSGLLRGYYKGRLARIGKGPTEAEDLVQEAVLAIHFKRHTYDPGQPLTPWVSGADGQAEADFHAVRLTEAVSCRKYPGAIPIQRCGNNCRGHLGKSEP